MKKLVCCIFLLVLGLTQNGFAAPVQFDDFLNIDGLQLNNSAVHSPAESLVRLTTAKTQQAGSMFTKTQVDTAAFSTYFTFRMTGSGGYNNYENPQGADGIVFVLQNDLNKERSIGATGEGIGYLGIDNSLGIEFDTWFNGNRKDPKYDHIGINTNGSVNSRETANVDTDFNNGNIWHNWIDYDGTSLEIRSTMDSTRPDAALLTYGINIESILGTKAYVGFTSATGESYASHELLSWNYENVPAPVPVPGSILILGSGLLGFACLSRRTRV